MLSRIRESRILWYHTVWYLFEDLSFLVYVSILLTIYCNNDFPRTTLLSVCAIVVERRQYCIKIYYSMFLNLHYLLLLQLQLQDNEVHTCFCWQQ